MPRSGAGEVIAGAEVTAVVGAEVGVVDVMLVAGEAARVVGKVVEGVLGCWQEV